MEDLKLLAQLANRENRLIDFKEKFDPESSQDWARIIKDIIAFANSGGGIIVFGVKDDGSPSDFDKNLVLRIDSAVIADKISSYTGENFVDFEIVEVARNKKGLAALVINASPSPLVFTKAGADLTDRGKQKPAFAKGSVYFRHGAKSDPGTTNDIRATINKEVERLKRSWLQGVRKIANIRPGEEVIVSRFGNKENVLGRIVPDKNAKAFRPDNAAEIWPYRAKELVAAVNEKLKSGKISFHDTLCIRRRYGIDEKKNPDFVYKPYADLSPRYSKEFAIWLLSKATKNPGIFRDARDWFKNSRGRK